VKRWNEVFYSPKAENQRLSKWKNVADAEVKAEKMVRTAHSALGKAHADANDLIVAARSRRLHCWRMQTRRPQHNCEDADRTASTTTLDAKQQAKTLRDQAQAILDSATTQAAQIVDAANKKAEEVAGSAYEA